MFKTRLLSGILLVIAALLTIISGGYVLFITLLCISLIGMQELYKAMGVHKEKAELLEITGYLGAVLYYGAVLLDFERYGTMAILTALVLLMFVYVFTYPKYKADQVIEEIKISGLRGRGGAPTPQITAYSTIGPFVAAA